MILSFLNLFPKSRFDDAQTCEDFEDFRDVIQLEEISE